MKNLFFILIFSACVLSAQAKDYIVTDYSVSMDSTQLNTAAIQSVRRGNNYYSERSLPFRSFIFQAQHKTVFGRGSRVERF